MKTRHYTGRTLAGMTLALFIVLSGCTTKAPTLKDCGVDTLCFEEAAKDCTPAKIEQSEIHGKTYHEAYFELRGIADNNCKMYVKLKALKASGMESASQEIQDRSNEAIEKTQGKAMVCNLPKVIDNPKGITNLQKLFEDSFLSQYCSGPLKDAVIELKMLDS